ncbi:MAG: glycine cleavage system protein GcvH [Planctomycetia bacterium]|nr:glycine cleavage system protein GcvH [Planctomycetia bacterium]
MNVPDNLLYSKEHEWVLIEGNTAKVGITDYAQDSLGDIVFVELPEIGKVIEPMGEVGIIESVKAVSPVYSPVGGKVTDVNTDLEQGPESLNSDPYGNYIFIMELDGEVDRESLLDAAAYAKFIEK